jgi:O-antigen/teichoic acid export membrane protein
MFYGGMSLRRISFFPFVYNPADIKKILIFSWPLIFAFSSGYVSDWFDLFVIKYFLTQKEVGIYQAAYQGMMATTIFLYAISSITFPIITMLRASRREDAIKLYLSRISPQMVFFISCFVSGLMIFITRETAGFFWGDEFGEAARPLIILLVCNSITSISVIYSAILSSYDLTLQMTVFTIVMAAINLLLDIVFVPLVGINGAAVATVISYAFAAVAYTLQGDMRLAVSNKKIFLGIIPVLLSSLICLTNESYLFRFITVVPLLIASYFAVSLMGWIVMKDYDLLVQNVNIPLKIKKLIRNMYSFSSRIGVYSSYF